jgi:hypothetical protein
MKWVLIAANVVIALVAAGWAVEHFVLPKVALEIYGGDYQARMFDCNHVMREHFIAKQMVLAEASETTIRNLEAAEIGLTACHDYDRLRKKMLGWGVSENQLAWIGLEAMEDRARDVRKFVETHEIRY